MTARVDVPEERPTFEWIADDLVEPATLAAMRLVGAHPAQHGRMLVARVIGGFPIPTDRGLSAETLEHFDVLKCSAMLRVVIPIVDALVLGGLLEIGADRTLTLTDAGRIVLEHFDGVE